MQKPLPQPSSSREKNLFTVSDLTSSIKIHLESRFPRLRVLGEISNLSRQSSGHIYFTLKDRDASIACVMFRSFARALNMKLAQGNQVIVCGDLRVYEPRGVYQLSVVEILPSGIGDLHQEFERRKRAFLEKGYFEKSLKKELPFFPKKIAVITSPTGAVLKDILQVIARRCSIGLELVVFPVSVQGSGADQEIARAIRLANQDQQVDVLILARGGGAIEDLWAFNEVSVVEGIFSSVIPVISAIGHETDFTLADFTADHRAATPSVAGEISVPDVKALRQGATDLFRRLNRLVRLNLERNAVGLQSLSPASIRERLYRTVQNRSQDLDNLELALFNRGSRIVHQKRSSLPGGREDVQPMLDRFGFLLESQIQRLEILRKRLEIGNPRKILEKGYSILLKDGEPVFELDSIQSGDELNIEVLEGSLRVNVKEKIYEPR
jgi:exodeoxyribonuclease VII large subunit